jgi:Skp family chaperone for outer membrane proteins
MRTLALLAAAAFLSVSCFAQTPTTAGPQPAKTTPRTPAAPAKSKALLAAEQRIADLEAEVADRDNKLAAAEAELKPLKKTMADIAAAAISVSKIAPTDTVAGNRRAIGKWCSPFLEHKKY